MKLDNIYNSYTAVRAAQRSSRGFDPSNRAQEVSFKGSLIEKTRTSINYIKMDKIMSAVDDVLGQKGYLSDKLNKANLSVTDNKLVLKKHTIFKDVLSTIKYPVTRLPFRLLNALSIGLKKTPFSSLGDKISSSRFVQKGIEKLEAERNYELVENILESFCSKNIDDVDKLSRIFSKNRTGKITQTVKNYASRDERTLNRFVTGGVGALLSGVDMYNISMLEKNDKESAKKAQKDRREQEMTRIALSSALTFLSLGALARYTRHSVLKNAAVIAGSTLIAEVFSRVRKHKPLVPLTPQQAQEYAKNHKVADLDPSFSSVKLIMNHINKNGRASLYKDFIKNKNTDTQNNLEENKGNHPAKKNNRTLRKLGIGVILASLAYFTVRFAKGDYKKLIEQKKIYLNNKDIIDKFTKGETDDLGSNLLNKINSIGETNGEEKEAISKFKKFKKFKKIIEEKSGFYKFIKDNIVYKLFKKRINIDVVQFSDELTKLSQSAEAKNIAPIIKEYQKHIDVIAKGNHVKDNIYSEGVVRTIPSAINAGLTKLFKTFYTVLSSPALLIDKAIFGKTEKAFNGLNNMLGHTVDSSKFEKDYTKELKALYKLFEKYQGEDKYQKIAKAIEGRTRNFELGSETSDLANLSRTLVTLISSYFYVNDFRNSVLIESEGKNTKRAQEVMNDSIGFKMCNFFFNGTIMNLGNSIFNNLLNKSLLGATAIAAGEEITNEFLIRKTIARPMKKMGSKDEIIEFDRSKANKKGPFGAWTRFFKKMTGQKSLVEKYESQKTKKNKNK